MAQTKAEIIERIEEEICNTNLAIRTISTRGGDPLVEVDCKNDYCDHRKYEIKNHRKWKRLMRGLPST